MSAQLPKELKNKMRSAHHKNSDDEGQKQNEGREPAVAHHRHSCRQQFIFIAVSVEETKSVECAVALVASVLGFTHLHQNIF